MTTTTPVMTVSVCVQFRHYMVTVHAIERYIERIGGDVGNLILDLKNAWVFDVSKKGIPRSLCASVARCEREGGYGLRHDKAIFLIKPEARQHVIVTTLSAEVK